MVWALVAAVLRELEKYPQFRDSAEFVEVRRLYDTGETDSAFNLLTPIVKARAPSIARSSPNETMGKPDPIQRSRAVSLDRSRRRCDLRLLGHRSLVSAREEHDQSQTDQYSDGHAEHQMWQ